MHFLKILFITSGFMLTSVAWGADSYEKSLKSMTQKWTEKQRHDFQGLKKIFDQWISARAEERATAFTQTSAVVTARAESLRGSQEVDAA